MTVRTILIAAMTAACALGVPMVAAAETPPAAASAERASDAANMAVLDRFYLAFAMNDEATIAGLLAGAMIWKEGKGARFAGHNSDDVPGAVFEGVFGHAVAQFESFGASASLYLPSGSHVVALGHYAGYKRSTDELLNTGFAHVFTFSDGRIVHFQQFTETAPWIEDATPD